MGSAKSSFISTIVASICIIIYIAAIVFGAVQIILSTNDRRVLAQQEFKDLSDRASSAVILGFMSRAYQESLTDLLESSETLVGAIISGSDGQFGFERRTGTVISWVGDSPRFKSGFGMPKDPYHKVIRISGQRNGTIQAMYSVIDYELLLNILRQTMTLILASLAIAVFTLLIEILMKNRAPAYKPIITGKSLPLNRTSGENEPPKASSEETDEKKTPASVPEDPRPVTESGDKPEGLYSPRSNVGWEDYINDRLTSELHRCASSEQDLVFLIIEMAKNADRALQSKNRTGESFNNSLYRELAEETVKFLSPKDLVFEKGEHGLAAIIPGIDLEQGIVRSEEFCRRMEKRFPGILEAGLRMGISSRSGRLVEAERLVFESSQALLKAAEDPVSPIIAFKTDPEKYRKFISSR